MNTVTVEIPSVLRPRCAGQSRLALPAMTVQAVLDEIRCSYPDLYECICDETGSIRRHVNVFVNSSLVSKNHTTDTRVAPDDVVFIFQAVSGG